MNVEKNFNNLSQLIHPLYKLGDFLHVPLFPFCRLGYLQFPNRLFYMLQGAVLLEVLELLRSQGRFELEDSVQERLARGSHCARLQLVLSRPNLVVEVAETWVKRVKRRGRCGENVISWANLHCNLSWKHRCATIWARAKCIYNQ